MHTFGWWGEFNLIFYTKNIQKTFDFYVESEIKPTVKKKHILLHLFYRKNIFMHLNLSEIQARAYCSWPCSGHCEQNHEFIC